MAQVRPALRRVTAVWAACLLFIAACSQNAGARAAAIPPSPDFTAPIYSEEVPVSSGLPYVAATDAEESFTAPNGKTVQVLVKGPAGVGPNTPCPGSNCFVMRPINPGETPDTYFPEAVQAAIAANAHKLVIPQASYDFKGPTVQADSSDPSTCNEGHYSNCTQHWTIGSYPSNPIIVPDSIADLDIDLSGSVLNFTAPTTGIWILNAQRIRLENFTIDWPNLRIASLGTIVPDPKNSGHMALVIDDAYPVADQFTGGAVQIQAVDVWDSGAGSANPQGDFDLSAGNFNETYFIYDNAPQPTYVGKTSAGAQTYTCKSCNFVNSPTDSSCSMFLGCANFDLFPAGTRVLVRHYTYNGFAILVNWADDIDIENARVLTGPGIGISVGTIGGFRGFRFANSSVSRASGRLISTASDAVDIGNFRGDVMIENNEIAFQGDDGVNINSSFQAIASTAHDAIGVTGGCEPDTLDFPFPGDALAFFDPNLNYLGTATVGTVSGSICNAPMALQVAFDCAGSAACESMLAALSPADSFIDLTQQATARYIVRNNNFHENRGHGNVINAPYGLISGNTYDRNSSGGMSLNAGSEGGPGASNLIFSDNSIAWTGLDARISGAIALQAIPAQGIAPASVFQKIVVANNSISNTQGPAILTDSANYVELAGNVLSNTDLVTNDPAITLPFYGNYGSASAKDSIVIYDASQVQICATQTSGSTSGPVGIDGPSTSGVSPTSSCP